MLCHLSALSGWVGVPLGHILGPLLVWLFKKDESPFIDAEGKESLNFQISMTIYLAVSAILIFVVVGFVLIGILFIFNLVYVILASIEASKGQPYRYPLTIRFIK